MDTKVYDNFTIRCDVEEQIPSSYVAETFVSEEIIEPKEEMNPTEEEKEPETDSVAGEEEEGLEADSAAGEYEQETEADFMPQEEEEEPETDSTTGEYQQEPVTDSMAEKDEKKELSSAISVLVNGEPVVLRNKADYIFVDVLDFYPFDTSVAHGDHLELRVNGMQCDFTHPVKEGDQIQIEWVN